MNYATALSDASKGNFISVTVTSNQDNGIVTYMTGNLEYYKAGGGKILVTTGLQTASTNTQYLNAGPLQALFSDRFVPPTPGTLSAATQPFNLNAPDKVGLAISQDIIRDTITATFTLESWGNATFSVSLQVQPNGDLLFGSGTAAGNKNPNPALYTIAFTGTVAPERLPS